jgi:hypothetical protein
LAPIEAGEPLGKSRNFNTASKLMMAPARSVRAWVKVFPCLV